MLYRHVQPLFLSRDWNARAVRGPRMAVRPLDGDTPDHEARFLVWAAVHERPLRTAATPPDPNARNAGSQLLVEMSADGEGWTVVSTLTPRERPYLVTVSHMLRYVRMHLEVSGVEAVGYGMVLANTPFELDGPDPLTGSRP